MRILILCFATFAAGILAGSIFWPDDEIRRDRGRDGARDSRSVYDRGGYAEDEAGASADGPGATSSSSGETRASVRALTAEAARALAAITDGERGALLREADGRISGTVLDPSGSPIAGVMITVIPDARPFDLAANGRHARGRPHQDRDLNTVASDAIQGELWRRLARRSAESGQNGRFEITGVMDSSHSLIAFHEQFDVRPRTHRGKVRPGATIDFVASPIATARVEVRMPDGTLAENAWLRWSGPHGKGREPWMPDPGRVRLPVGLCKVKAEVWTPEPMESKEVEQNIVAGRAGDPIVLTLEQRRVLTARLMLPDGFAAPRRVEYRMRRVDEGEVEPESLLKDQSNRQAYTPAPTRAYWFDLEPGRYLVAAFLDRKRLIAHAIAEVGEGASEVELPVIEPETGSYVKVRLVGPDGGPVPGDVSFRIITKDAKGRQSNRRVDAFQQADHWLVMIDGVGGDGVREATMRVGTRDFGGATEEFSLRGGRTVSFRFDKAARLKVQVARFGGSGVEGSLYVALRGKLGADSWRLVAPDGDCSLGSVQPGQYDLMLYVRKNKQNFPILKRPINLSPGDEEMSVTVPTLHTLSVRYAGKGRPRDVVLRTKDESIGQLRRTARLSGRKAGFAFLAPGTYVVECARKKVTVRVPASGEVVIP